MHRLQRFGLGLLWTESCGAVLQSQGGSATAAWGTAAEGAAQVYEADKMEATFRVAGQAIQPKPGSTDLPTGTLTVTYTLGSKGEKLLEFTDRAIVVKIRHAGPFTESIPLIERENSGFSVNFEAPATATKAAVAAVRGGRTVTVMRVAAKDELTYRLEFAR